MASIRFLQPLSAFEDNSKEDIEKRTASINEYLTKDLQDLNVDTTRTDIPTSSTVSDMQIWNVAQTGENDYTATYEADLFQVVSYSYGKGACILCAGQMSLKR